MGSSIEGFVISQYGVISIFRPAWNGIKWVSKKKTTGLWTLRPQGITLAESAEHKGNGGFGRYSLVQQSRPPLWEGGKRWPPACGFGRTSRRLSSRMPPHALVFSAHRATKSQACTQKTRTLRTHSSTKHGWIYSTQSQRNHSTSSHQWHAKCHYSVN